jgi:Putative porin
MYPKAKLFTAAVTVLTLATALLGQTAAPPAKKKAATPSLSSEVKQLKDAVAAQQQQIQQLMQQLQARDQAVQQLQQNNQNWQQTQQQLQQAQSAAADAQQKAVEAETAANAQKDSVTKISTDLASVQSTISNSVVATEDQRKRVTALESVVGRFRFNGDIRIRGESFYQSYDGCTSCQDRQRARVRARFGFDGELNRDFIGGIALATGSLGDPTTTNETFTNFFDRKTIGLDRGYITYHPVAHRWLSLTGGKFAYQWQRTQVTGDPDINPEGFNEKLSWDLHTPVAKNITVNGIQYMLNEVAKGPDSFAAGGQVSSNLAYGPWTSTVSYMALNWRRPDQLLQASAFAVQAPTTGSSSTTNPVPTLPTSGEGPGCATGSSVSGLPAYPPCAFSPNGMTNATYLDSKGVPHFQSGFVYSDLILNNQVKTGLDRLPFNAILEYEDNLGARDAIDYKGKVATWLGKQSHAYLADVSLGQTKNKGDFQAGYAFLRQEQDSVLASFAESDQRAPTNIIQHRFYGLYKIRPNVVGGLTWWHGRTLNTNLENAALVSGFKPNGQPGHQEPWLNRLQFDLIYTF